MVSALRKPKNKRLASKLESSTLRGFGGGWNAIDEDLSMKPSFQVSLVNFNRTTSGAQAVRYGQMFNCDIRYVHDSDIIDGIYFTGLNVVFCKDGYVLTIDETGTDINIIWNGFPAGTVVDGPDFKQVSFVPFRDTLIIHTGQTKPLEIKSKPTISCDYLGDPVGGNVNVPIGQYGCVVSNYHCVARITETKESSPGSGVIVVDERRYTEIYISGSGTSGVFFGDPDTDAIAAIDVGAYAPEGAAEIRGIAGFRTYLLVFLQNITLQIKLGEKNEEGEHVPRFPDTLPQFGILGNRTIVTVENDIMFCGLSGLASAKRNLYSPDSITSDYLSTAISPAYRKMIGGHTDSEQMNNTFAAHDRLNNNFLLFVPHGHTFCYTFNPRLKMNAWSLYADMPWTAAWTSVLGRLFLVTGTKVFLGGNSTFGDEQFYADKMMDRDVVFDSASADAFVLNLLYYDAVADEVWKCTVAHPKTVGLTFEQERINNPSKWEQYEGKAIQIELELPWIDGKDPMKLKQLRYISIATKGDAEFTFDVYVDNLYKDTDGNEIFPPCVSLSFIGNDAFGYGYDDGGFGMGRRSRDPRLYALPVKFKTIKFKIRGSVSKKLEIVNLSFLYARNKSAGFMR